MITQAVTAMLVVMSTTMPAATAGPTTVSAPTDPIRIDLDAGTPPGHNFGYNDFLPRAGMRVHRGDLVNFAWASTPDGLHNVAVLRPGTTPTDAWATYPTIVPDADDSPQRLQLNPVINLGDLPATVRVARAGHPATTTGRAT
jgi:hypothetical protein